MAKKEEKEDEKAEKKEEAEGAEGEAKGEEGGEDGLGEEGKKKGGKKKLIIIAAAAVLLLAGGGAGLFFSGLLAPKTPVEADASAKGGDKAAKDAKDAKEDKDAKPAYFSLGDILVNLNSDPKHPNFLKIKVSLELADEKDSPALEAMKPRIIDSFQVYLRELRIEDLRGSAGLYRLREELLLRVTEIAQPIRVRDVLFQEMLVQ